MARLEIHCDTNRRAFAVVARLAADELRVVTGDDVDEADGIQRVLPVDDEERVGLVVEVEILAQQAPHGDWALGFGSSGVVRIEAERLHIADDVALGRKNAFERCARTHAGVAIDGQDAFPQG
jgi:hypothetical protein